MVIVRPLRSERTAARFEVCFRRIVEEGMGPAGIGPAIFAVCSAQRPKASVTCKSDVLPLSDLPFQKKPFDHGPTVLVIVGSV